MTKVITRYYDSAEQANAVQKALLAKRLPKNTVRVFTERDGLVKALTALEVEQITAEAYEMRMEDSGAVVLVEAGYRPLSVAAIARELMDSMAPIRLGNMSEEVYVPDRPGKVSSVLVNHPLFMTRVRDSEDTNYHMANWPIPLISRRKPADNFAFPRHARMAEWPVPLIARLKPRDEFAFPRHARMADYIFPLTIRWKPSDKFIFPRHARMANALLPLTNRRKPFDGTLIPRHARMANWPFPHLINGKTGTNALMPGAPRMADYPVPLLSKRKPIDAFAFPRHARMADRFLPLTNRRKPFTGTIIPKHGRMANFLLPLVTKSSSNTDRKGARFSLSRMFGLPTLSSR
ncbi:MAG: PucR family transcriptional regulator [Rhodobacteraceae bacterium]|nr:PucR family transcriptional regulator [Paracoccaceae bacterium]